MKGGVMSPKDTSGSTMRCVRCVAAGAMPAQELCCQPNERLLPRDEFAELQALTADLPPDPYLPNRFKRIGFAHYSSSGELVWDTTERGHFLVGNAAYKYVQGGDAGSRHYAIFSRELRESRAMARLVGKFRELSGQIPADSPILVQAQRTEYVDKRVPLDITYEGVHSGGGKYAMFFTYLRRKTKGAENSLHENEAFESVFWGPEAIEENSYVFFRDEDMYHHVTPPVFEDDSGARGIYVLHWPAEPYRTEGNVLRHEDGRRLYVAK